MGASVKAILPYYLSFLFVLFLGSTGEDVVVISNPCSNSSCSEGSLCWNDGGVGRCENACNSSTVYCGEDNLCVTEVGPCGNSSCKPVAGCRSLSNITDLCHNITCLNDTKCTIVAPIFPTGPVPMAICGPNPCLEHTCCRDAVGSVCEKDACYLRRAPGTSLTEIRLEPWCVNPCLLHDLQCEKPDEFCYTKRVKCFAPPCNPVPVCRKPCELDPQTICGPGLKCEVVSTSCLEDDDDLSFGFGDTCQPAEHCVPESEIIA